MGRGQRLNDTVCNLRTAGWHRPLVHCEANDDAVVPIVREMPVPVLNPWRNQKEFPLRGYEFAVANGSVLPSIQDHIEFIEVVRMHGSVLGVRPGIIIDGDKMNLQIVVKQAHSGHAGFKKLIIHPSVSSLLSILYKTIQYDSTQFYNIMPVGYAE